MLNQLDPENVLQEIPELKQQSYTISRGIHKWVLDGGKPRREMVDLLHGTWLGHPLHPVLTDVTIGAWIFSLFLDFLSLTSRSKGIRRAADTLLNIGNTSAVATALAGLADYSAIPRPATATGGTHALLNILGLVLNLFSSMHRRRRNRLMGIWLSSISSTIMLASAWLGGEMTYKYKVGVNRIPKSPARDKWYATGLNDRDLPEMTPRRVEVEGFPVLLYRYQGQIYAIGAVCGHEGAPLDEGTFEGYCVTCPWHQSVYDLRDGSVVHGPTAYAEQAFEVRLQQGMIEVRPLISAATEEAIRMVRDTISKAKMEA